MHWVRRNYLYKIIMGYDYHLDLEANIRSETSYKLRQRRNHNVLGQNSRPVEGHNVGPGVQAPGRSVPQFPIRG